MGAGRPAGPVQGSRRDMALCGHGQRAEVEGYRTHFRSRTENLRMSWMQRMKGREE